MATWPLHRVALGPVQKGASWTPGPQLPERDAGDVITVSVGVTGLPRHSSCVRLKARRLSCCRRAATMGGFCTQAASQCGSDADLVGPSNSEGSQRDEETVTLGAVCVDSGAAQPWPSTAAKTVQRNSQPAGAFWILLPGSSARAASRLAPRSACRLRGSCPRFSARRVAGMINPRGRRKASWDWLVILFVIGTTVFTPLDLSFFDGSCDQAAAQARARCMIHCTVCHAECVRAVDAAPERVPGSDGDVPACQPRRVEPERTRHRLRGSALPAAPSLSLARRGRPGLCAGQRLLGRRAGNILHGRAVRKKHGHQVSGHHAVHAMHASAALTRLAVLLAPQLRPAPCGTHLPARRLRA